MGQVVVWTGWAAGIAIGAYVLLQFLVSGKALGASTGFGNVCGLVSKHPFFRTGKFADRFNWRFWFTVGVPLGGFVALLTSGVAFSPHFDMGPMYETVMPSALWARGLVLVAGGVLIGYGARLAGGCTSGHGIVGSALLNPPSILAAAGFFVGGIVSAQALFALFA
jgi:uncharacterized protein